MTRRLHIGGTTRCPGWEVVNTVPAPYVDHVCNANDLSRFRDDTFAQVYASHIVEHLDYKEELHQALLEWHRVLVPGGTLFVSVPDLDTLSNLFLDKENLDFDERFFVMQMMFGGHVDEYDYHIAGLNQEFLGAFLNDAGFVDIQRVQNFGLFDDASSIVYKGVPISLNMLARKPAP